MYSTSPPTPQRPNPLGASSSAASTPAGGVTHKDMAPQVSSPHDPGPGSPALAAAAACWDAGAWATGTPWGAMSLWVTPPAGVEAAEEEAPRGLGRWGVGGEVLYMALWRRGDL